MESATSAVAGVHEAAPPRRLSHLGDELLARYVARDSERAFTILYERYYQKLYRYCRSILRDDADAQDALQATFVGALTALRRNQRNAPVRPWLYRIAHNEAISLLRKRSRHSTEELTTETLGSASSAEQEVADRARWRSLMEDLGRLPDRQRGALLLRELSGLTHEEIGMALGTTTAGAKQAIFEARQGLGEIEEGRAMNCEDVRRRLSEGDRRALRGRRVRAHLRACSACEVFALAIPARRAELRALTPLLSPAAAAALLTRSMHAASAIGAVGSGGSSAAGGSSSAVGSSTSGAASAGASGGTSAVGAAGATKAIGTALAWKGLAGAVLIAGATAGVSSFTHLLHHAPAQSHLAAAAAEGGSRAHHRGAGAASSSARQDSGASARGHLASAHSAAASRRAQAHARSAHAGDQSASAGAASRGAGGGAASRGAGGGAASRGAGHGAAPGTSGAHGASGGGGSGGGRASGSSSPGSSGSASGLSSHGQGWAWGHEHSRSGGEGHGDSTSGTDTHGGNPHAGGGSPGGGSGSGEGSQQGGQGGGSGGHGRGGSGSHGGKHG